MISTVSDQGKFDELDKLRAELDKLKRDYQYKKKEFSFNTDINGSFSDKIEKEKELKNLKTKMDEKIEELECLKRLFV